MDVFDTVWIVFCGRGTGGGERGTLRSCLPGKLVKNEESPKSGLERVKACLGPRTQYRFAPVRNCSDRLWGCTGARHSQRTSVHRSPGMFCTLPSPLFIPKQTTIHDSLTTQSKLQKNGFSSREDAFSYRDMQKNAIFPAENAFSCRNMWFLSIKLRGTFAGNPLEIAGGSPTTKFAQPRLSRVKGRSSPARGYKFGCVCSYAEFQGSELKNASVLSQELFGLSSVCTSLPGASSFSSAGSTSSEAELHAAQADQKRSQFHGASRNS